MKEACDRLERLPVLKFGVVGAGPRSIGTDLFDEATRGVKCWTTRLLRNAANRWRTLAQRRRDQVHAHDDQTDGTLPFNCLRPGLDEPVYFRASSSRRGGGSAQPNGARPFVHRDDWLMMATRNL